MVLTIIAIIDSFLMSFLGYVYVRVVRANKDESKHPILLFIVEYLSFFLSVTWIILFYVFLGLL